MISTLKKKKGKYKKWMTLSPGSVLIATSSKSGGADRKLMANFVGPFISVLNKFSITLHDFVNIWKKYKVLREIQQKIIFEEQFKISVEKIIIISSTRQLDHTNAVEKNIIFTYHAFSDPEKLKKFFFYYILYNIPNNCNKKDLYFELIKEVDEVQKEFRQSKGNLTQSILLDQNSSHIPISTNSSSSSPTSNALSSPNQIPQQVEVTSSPNHTLSVLNENILPNDKGIFDNMFTDDAQTDFIFNGQFDLDSFDLFF